MMIELKEKQNKTFKKILLEIVGEKKKCIDFLFQTRTPKSSKAAYNEGGEQASTRFSSSS